MATGLQALLKTYAEVHREEQAFKEEAKMARLQFICDHVANEVLKEVKIRLTSGKELSSFSNIIRVFVCHTVKGYEFISTTESEAYKFINKLLELHNLHVDLSSFHYSPEQHEYVAFRIVPIAIVR